MEIKDRDNARQILYEIDALSESAAKMKDTLECFRESGGKVKILVHTCKEQTVTELNDYTAGIVMKDIINEYNDAITVRKSKLESVLRNAIVKLT